MMLLVRLILCAPAVLLCASLSGCSPSGQSRIEEEKEPHFLEGKRCINTMDYRGAIEEFEKALEVNPHSAAAHFEVACLYVQKEPDPAAAVYHFEKYLRLRPDAANAETVRQLIYTCKQDLAKTVLPLPITPGMQRQFEQLADENRRLREENERWKAHFSGAGATATPPNTTSPVPSTDTARTSPVPLRTNLASVPIPSPALRLHTVQQGETPSSIARKYGVKLQSLMAANPGLDPRRMRVGQIVNVPSP